MPFRPSESLPRCGVVDLGSNSVRLVVFEGLGRNPTTIFNEKAVLRLGKGLEESGHLNQDGVEQAITVIHRYHAVARAMGASPFEILATAAVRDAVNGPAFVADLRARMPGVPITVLSGSQEAEFSADGLLCGIPDADGILADIGGGSLEVVRLDNGRRGASQTLRLGVIRLSDRARGDIAVARELAEADMARVPWLTDGAERDLFLVGGAWRALARIHIARSGYPLNIVHQYTIGRDQAREFVTAIEGMTPRMLEKLKGAPKRRIGDLPYAAVALRRLLRVTNARRVVFSASGLREGWFMRGLTDEVRAQDPLLVAARELTAQYGRDPALPPFLMEWTAPLFAGETDAAHRLRLAACWLSDIGSHDHPEFRAEQAFLRVLRQPGIGIDHPSRAFLAITLALRYEAAVDADFLRPARRLLEPAVARRAEILGMALRLAFTLSAGTPDLLGGTSLAVRGPRLVLQLHEDSGVFAGESVVRRLDRLAEAIGLQAEPQSAVARAAE